jgi:hypothetical protein
MSEPSEQQSRELKQVDPFQFLRETIEKEPLTIEIHFSDGVQTFTLHPGDPWYARLARERALQIAKLRSQLN